MRLEKVSEVVGVFVNTDNRIEKFNELINTFLISEIGFNVSLDLEVDDNICYVKLSAKEVSLSILLAAQRQVTITLEQLYK